MPPLNSCTSIENIIKSNAQIDIPQYVIHLSALQAQQFVEVWEGAMAAVEAKSQELQGMSAVGADIESVKSQLEEHKVRQTTRPFFHFLFFQLCHFIFNFVSSFGFSSILPLDHVHILAILPSYL